MRGNGLQLKTKFKWSKQSNGNYTIYDVPIFKSFSDDNEVVTEEDLSHIEYSNKKLKDEEGFFARVHIGHHSEEGTENLRHAGFLDFVRRDGKNLVADIVEIPGTVFLEIKDGVYPQRSVERRIKDGLDYIRSLALLRTREPYHKGLGILALEEKQSPQENFQDVYYQQRSTLLMYQAKGEINMGFFTTSGSKNKTKSYEDKEKNDVYTEDKSEDKVYEEETGEKEESYQDGDKMDYLVSCMDEIKVLLAKLVGVKSEEDNEENEVEKSQVDEEYPGGVSPQMMAYQAKISSMEKQMVKMKEMVSKYQGDKKQDELDNRIKQYCAVSGGDFGQVKAMADRFSTYQDKETFISTLENSGGGSGVHRSTSFARSFNKSQIDQKVKKYQAAGLDSFAAKCYRDYEQASNGRDGHMFRSMWSNADQYVDFFVDQEQRSPGYYSENMEK